MLELNIPAGPLPLNPQQETPFAITPVINDPRTGERGIEIVTDDGMTLAIPQKFLEALATHSARANQALNTALNEIRLAALNPTALGLRKLEVGGNYLTAYVSGSHEGSPEDGTPVLTWMPFQLKSVRHQAAEGGWALQLHGSPAQLGFAAWDDPEGLTTLVQAMDDPESLFALGGLIDGDSIAALSSRILARELRRGRQLPGIDLGKVRRVLQANRLDAASRGFEDDKYGAPRGRVLTIKSEGVQVPVAVAVVGAPRIPGTRTNRSTPLQNDVLRHWNEEWHEQVTAALVGAGWRKVDLPLPRGFTGRYDYEAPRGVRYFTRIDPETWGSVATAAGREAAQLEINRGAVL
jgi:hypothetical protein